MSETAGVPRPWAAGLALARGALLGCLFLAGLSGGCAAEPMADLAVVGVALVDVETGVALPDRTVRIGGGRILSVEPADPGGAVDAAACLDGRGLWAVPGLWDMHTHALWDASVAGWTLDELARHGITGIRDMGGDLAVLDGVRSAPESRRAQWPRLFAAGAVLDGPEPVDPSISRAVGTAIDAVAAVDDLAGRGVDLIKVYTLLPRDAFFAAIGRAAAVGLPVAGHVPAEVTVAEAVAAGLSSIEHLRDELAPFCDELDEAACAALIAEMATAGVRNTPTLAILEAKTLPGYGWGAEAGDGGLPAPLAGYWRQAAARQAERPADYFAWRRQRFAAELALVGRLHRAGAPLLAGSDTGSPGMLPGPSLHRELELLVTAGLTPREALDAATLGATRFLGIGEEVGALRTGLAADMVLLESDPLESISNVRAIAGVVLGGRVLESMGGGRAVGVCGG